MQAHMSSFGKEIREIRKAKKLTLKHVADYLDVRVSYLCDVELGRRRLFSSKLIEKFCTLFPDDADQNYLFSLAIQGRDRVEIFLKTGLEKVNKLAFTLAREVEDGRIDDEFAEVILKLIEERKSDGRRY